MVRRLISAANGLKAVFYQQGDSLCLQCAQCYQCGLEQVDVLQSFCQVCEHLNLEFQQKSVSVEKAHLIRFLEAEDDVLAELFAEDLRSKLLVMRTYYRRNWDIYGAIVEAMKTERLEVAEQQFGHGEDFDN